MSSRKKANKKKEQTLSKKQKMKEEIDSNYSEGDEKLLEVIETENKNKRNILRNKKKTETKTEVKTETKILNRKRKNESSESENEEKENESSDESKGSKSEDSESSEKKIEKSPAFNKAEKEDDPEMDLDEKSFEKLNTKYGNTKEKKDMIEIFKSMFFNFKKETEIKFNDLKVQIDEKDKEIKTKENEIKELREENIKKNPKVANILSIQKKLTKDKKKFAFQILNDSDIDEHSEYRCERYILTALQNRLKKKQPDKTLKKFKGYLKNDIYYLETTEAIDFPQLYIRIKGMEEKNYKDLHLVQFPHNDFLTCYNTIDLDFLLEFVDKKKRKDIEYKNIKIVLDLEDEN